MSDQSSKSKPTLPSTSLKQELELSQPQSMASTTSGSGDPNESQIGEPPPGGGQRPGEDLNKAPPPTSDL